MIRIPKKVIIFSSVLVALVILIVIGKIGWKVLSELEQEAINLREEYTPGTATYKHRIETEKEIARQWEHIHSGLQFEQSEKYENAIQEYIKALEIVKNTGNEYIVRNGLSRCYEKTSQYQLAIQEIDWLLERYDPNEKPELIKELQQRKANLEKLLQQQTQAK